MEELDITQLELAKRLGVPAPGVSKALSEETAPRIDTLLRWAEALETTPQWLLGTDKLTAAPRPPNALEMALHVLDAFELPKDRLDAIKAVLFATDSEMHGIEGAIVPVLKRLGVRNKSQSTG